MKRGDVVIEIRQQGWFSLIVPTSAGRCRLRFAARVVCAGLVLCYATAGKAEDSYRGIRIAPEHRCSSYEPADYSYPQHVEARIIDGYSGLVYGPYTGTCFDHSGQTDIEHIVARSEAHDSGLCAADPATRKAFSRDLLNLTLASPAVNRYRKSGNDVAEWIPGRNACWFANRTIEVRRKYALTIDRAEAAAVENILARCDSTTMVFVCHKPLAETSVTSPQTDALSRWDDNGNGRITCAEARRHGIAPVLRGHPAYQYMRDGDGDGMVCE